MVKPSLRQDLQKAVEVLKKGGLVVYPTDTLYGLGVHAFLPGAVEKVFQVKGRSSLKAIPLLISSEDDLPLVAQEFSELARRLARKFWPGALTLILKASNNVPRLVTGGGDTVAVRVPNHPIPRELVQALGAPITGTSANCSGGPQPVTVEMVHEQLGGLVHFILDLGPCPGARPSTVLDVTGQEPILLREGLISRQDIEKACEVLAKT